MKKIMKISFAIMVASMMVVSMLSVSTSATTKNDLLEMAKSSPLYKYADISLQNLLNTIEITDEQAEQMKPFVQEVLDAVDTDKGASAANYTAAQRDLVLNNLTKAADVIGLKVKLETKGSNTVINLYNEKNEVVYQYDGSPVKDTAGINDNGYLFLIGGGVLALAAAAMFVMNRKAV